MYIAVHGVLSDSPEACVCMRAYVCACVCVCVCVRVCVIVIMQGECTR